MEQDKTSWAVHNKLAKPKAYHQIVSSLLLQELANVAHIKVICPNPGITISSYQPIYSVLADCFDNIARLNDWHWQPSATEASTVVFYDEIPGGLSKLTGE